MSKALFFQFFYFFLKYPQWGHFTADQPQLITSFFNFCNAGGNSFKGLFIALAAKTVRTAVYNSLQSHFKGLKTLENKIIHIKKIMHQEAMLGFSHFFCRVALFFQVFEQ